MALNIPKTFFAGDTLAFTDAVTAYPAGEGWTLKYSLVNADGQIEIVSTANGNDHAFLIAAATTSAWGVGEYKWAAYATKGAEKHTVATGGITIKPDFTSATDQRSHVEKVLDALEATLEGKASVDQQSMSINGRSIARLTPSELLQWRDKYRAERASLKRAERVAQGLPAGNKVMVRF